MLIDASRPEETRVVVVRNNRIEEFDYESKDRKQLRGNIYLARVTRVEPSLQAAFVEYGGNRQGFLAFSEIHPDYYQIPVADREALLAEEAAENSREDNDEEAADNKRNVRRAGRGSDRNSGRNKNNNNAKAARQNSDSVSDAPANALPAAEPVGFDDDFEFDDPEIIEVAASDDQDDADDSSDINGSDADNADSSFEEVGDEGDAMEEVPVRRKSRRQYKIQEVIKRRQIMLIQVVKEERGNKGAALTSYLSLAGRYSVLMPNTARGGGISRKITQASDRSRLKSIVSELDVPKGMGVILRTAGANRTPDEIKRDYDYMMRMWTNVRDLTLSSSAPALVYEEGNLIKRSIRDLYNKEIREIVVSGDEGFREAKEFMRMLMPSHAKVVQPYNDPLPIFSRNGIDGHLDKMLAPQVSLKSGGYLVINQTEALVAIDVNSGRSTKEHSIEDTAVQTNLEAAEEVARQLRLRDLAGLIVVDFIDMMEHRNNRAVERKMKECLKGDRARIQVGRISHFGLLEMSRQRMRTSVIESAMQPCPHCTGTGMVRSDNSFALHVLRMLEEHLLKEPRNHVIAKMLPQAALSVLNLQRRIISDLENQFGLTITFEGDPSLGHDDVTVMKGEPANNDEALEARTKNLAQVAAASKLIEDDDPEIDESEFESAAANVGSNAAADDDDDASPDEAGDNNDGGNKRGKRTRRRRRGGKDKETIGENGSVEAQSDNEDNSESDDDDSENGRKRRRGRRGGKRRRRENERTYTPYAEPIGFSDEEVDTFVQEDRAAREARAEAKRVARESAKPSDSKSADAKVTDAKNDDDDTNGKAHKNGGNAVRSEPKFDPNRPVAISVALIDDNGVILAPPVVEPKEAVENEAEAIASAEPAVVDITPAPKAMPELSPEPAPEVKAQAEPVIAESVQQVASNGSEPESAEKPKRRAPSTPQSTAPIVTSTAPQTPKETEAEDATAEKPSKKGWWQRRGFF